MVETFQLFVPDLELILTFVRTKAEPLPGLTCRNSTTRQTCPSNSMVVPVRKSLLEIIPVLHPQGS